MTMFEHRSVPLEPFVNPRPAPTIPISRPQPIPEYPHNPLEKKVDTPYLVTEKLWQATRVERAYKSNRNRETGRGRSRSRSAATARSDLVEAKAHLHQAGKDFKIALNLAVSVVKSFPSLMTEKRERRRFKACEVIQRREMAVARMDGAL